MLRDTMKAFETLLAADGVSGESLACVRAVVENDGMVTTGQAIRALRRARKRVDKAMRAARLARESGAALVASDELGAALREEHEASGLLRAAIG